MSLSDEINVFADRAIRMVDIVYVLSRYDTGRLGDDIFRSLTLL